ncbi:MAG: hypothetical protein AAGI46_03645 [Planctomycetota bacterium]
MLLAVSGSLTVLGVVEAFLPSWLDHGIALVLCLMTIVLVTVWALQTLARPRITRAVRSRLARHCDSCGYNLTGNASGVCPECGNKVGL